MRPGQNNRRTSLFYEDSVSKNLGLPKTSNIPCRSHTSPTKKSVSGDRLSVSKFIFWWGTSKGLSKNKIIITRKSKFVTYLFNLKLFFYLITPIFKVAKVVSAFPGCGPKPLRLLNRLVPSIPQACNITSPPGWRPTNEVKS